MRKPLLVTVSVGSAILVAAAVAWCCLALWPATRPAPRAFPEGFLFGVASSSYQIEGAWDEDGKSESIWDRLVHSEPCAIEDCSNGDIAADSYHLYRRDVEMLRELGVDFYRFSLSWPRLLPAGLPGRPNTAAVDFYNNYINEMIKYNITPVVTLFHGDYPQKLEELGGWSSPRAADWFAGYARTAFQLFGDRVKFWITINEPEYSCYQLVKHFGLNENITLRLGPRSSECTKNMLMAHAKVWHMYDEEFRLSQGGNISIAISSIWYVPENVNNIHDVQAAEDIFHVNFGFYVDPIFCKSGKFPTAPARGYALARLPDFTEKEKAFLYGTSDYFGLIHYTTKYVYKKETVRAHNVTPRYMEDVDVWMYDLPEWKIGTPPSSTINDVPWGFNKLLSRIRRDYDNPPVFVFENGFATGPGLQDEARIRYLRGYMAAMLDAIEEGSDIRGYTVWSLMDSFEWNSGYRNDPERESCPSRKRRPTSTRNVRTSELQQPIVTIASGTNEVRFGLYEVSHSPQTRARARRPRASARFYGRVVRARALPPQPADRVNKD